MGQITEAFCQQMLVHCERGEHPPLTVWEAQQLAYAWLKQHAPRESNDYRGDGLSGKGSQVRTTTEPT